MWKKKIHVSRKQREDIISVRVENENTRVIQVIKSELRNKNVERKKKNMPQLVAKACSEIVYVEEKEK